MTVRITPAPWPTPRREGTARYSRGNSEPPEDDTSPALIAALVPLVVAAAAFEVFVLVDLRRATGVQYLPKWGWALVVLLSVPAGGIVYLLVGRGNR
jgi:hypothetical protein